MNRAGTHFTSNEIIAALGEEGHGLNKDVISRWKSGGYQALDWFFWSLFFHATAAGAALSARVPYPGGYCRNLWGALSKKLVNRSCTVFYRSMTKPSRIVLLGAAAFAVAVACSAAGKKPAHAAKDAPFTLMPACPCFDLIGDGTVETKIDAALNIPEADRAGWRFEAKLLGNDGSVVATASADASRGTLVEASLRVSVQQVATFKVTGRLFDALGSERARGETDVHVIPPEESQVTVGPSGFLEIQGMPHFVIGMYSSGHFPEMAAAGFSATHSYAITTGDATNLINFTDVRLKGLLDASWSNGLRMMVELPRKAIEKGDWAQVIRRIKTFRHHPGLLCWGSEERVARGLTSITNIAHLYHLVHELDPDHPFVLGDSRDRIQKFKTDRRNFFPDPYMDVGIWWWYPIPLKDPDGNGLLEGREKTGKMFEGPSWLTTTLSKKPLWIAIQAYQHPQKGARFPTPVEYRCQSYLSIIYGVKGLWFYTGSGQRDYQGKPAGLLNKPEEAHWDYVQKLVRELRSFSPVIMAPKGSAEIKQSPADAPVEFTTREYQGSLYVIAANKSSQPQSVVFSDGILGGKQPQVLFEPGDAKISGNDLKCALKPFGVQVIKIKIQP
ncbi:MAG TPA: hypothetical protein VHH88_01905 [Verrucomicrobiae bacterium]|nr:hypothetical protein [Verrucomicrobiae bacterium]